MLERLRTLHLEILDKLGELEQLVASDQPQLDRLMSVRLALTRASRARTMLLENEVYPALLTATEAGTSERIRTLQAEGKADLLASTQHIGQWSHRTIADDWSRYRAASNTVRAAMRKRIKQEQDVLYPVLARI